MSSELREAAIPDKMDMWEAGDPYLDWIEAEGVKRIVDYKFPDLNDVELGDWERKGGKGAVVHIDNAHLRNDMHVVDIKPGCKSEPEHHMYEISFYIVSGLGATTVEFRNYGVQLQYTPTVLANGRISLRVRPEVSDISSVGAVRFGGTEIPAVITRRAETTVELGSGQSFMIAGLLSNASTSSVEKMPGAGDIPILGNLFKSNGWRRNETELMIIVTPYLVEPVSDNEIVLPTDGYQSPNDAQRLLLNRQSDGVSGGTRPMPTIAPEEPAGPAIGNAAPANSKARASNDTAAPGFSY